MLKKTFNERQSKVRLQRNGKKRETCKHSFGHRGTVSSLNFVHVGLYVNSWKNWKTQMEEKKRGRKEGTETWHVGSQNKITDTEKRKRKEAKKLAQEKQCLLNTFSLSFCLSFIPFPSLSIISKCLLAKVSICFYGSLSVSHYNFVRLSISFLCV